MVDYLVQEVGVPAESIPALVQRCPKLLGCSIDRNLRPTLRFLEDEVLSPLLPSLIVPDKPPACRVSTPADHQPLDQMLGGDAQYIVGGLAKEPQRFASKLGCWPSAGRAVRRRFRCGRRDLELRNAELGAVEDL